MVTEFCGFDKGVIGKKLPSDSTLKNMKKEELIKLLHVAQHNYETLMEFYNNAVKANEVISNMSIDAFAETMCVSVCENTFQVTLPDGFKADAVTIDCVMELVMQIAKELKGGAD